MVAGMGREHCTWAANEQWNTPTQYIFQNVTNNIDVNLYKSENL